MLKYFDESELDSILTEAAVHIKLSMDISNSIIKIYYPLYKYNYKNENYLLIPLELGLCTLTDYLEYLQAKKKVISFKEISLIIIQIIIHISKFH